MTGIVVAETGTINRGKFGIAGAAVLAVLLSSTGAIAQATPNCTSSQVGGVANLVQLASPASAVAGALTGAIGNINTMFLTQQGSAFVSAPRDPSPNQPGGGVWARAVGGQVNLKSTSTSSGAFLIPGSPAANTTISTNCANNQSNDFVGVQVGQDISRLNWGGWNVHLGTTAGYVESRSNDSLAGFSTKFEVPFVGGYAVATHGRFFADVMLRSEFYNMRLNDPALGFQNQPTGARGNSITASAGYNFDMGNNWFIEPSAGFIYSKTRVDSFTSAGTAVLPIVGTNSVSDITSQIGRLSLRAGTTISSGNVIWQPFGSVSVFHEFAGSVTSSYTSLNATFIPFGGPPPTFPASYDQQTSTTRVGTYGQYSLGVAGQIVNTGWLGFARVDYRNGNNIDGWTGNAGIRYQFTPEMIAAVFPTKAPVKARGAVLAPVNWTGFYVGGFFGADYGTTDVRFPADPAAGNKIWAFGAIGGAQAGYNYQVNKWVFGVEGDIGAANIKGSRTCGNNVGASLTTPGLFTPVLFACTSEMDWIATATARVGYAYERTLYYVKGGGAWTNASMTAGCIIAPALNGPANNPHCNNTAGVVSNGFSASSSRSGWTIGYGAEFDLGGNWSAKAEYDYIDFGRKTLVATDGALISDHPTQSQVKIGVNYRFSGPAALVARY